MTADIAELGFKVDASDIDHAIKKFGLLDREFGKVEKSGGLVSRSFESVGESGKKSGGLVSRAFREASQDLDKALRSITRLASELGDLARISRVDIDVQLNTQSINRELSDLRSRLGGGVLTLDINADLTRVTSEIASLRQGGGVNINVTATSDTSRAIADIDALKKAASDVAMNITAHADTGRALAELNSLRNQAGQIQLDIDVNVSGAATSAKLNDVRDAVLSLNQAIFAGTRYLHDYNNELERIRGSVGDAAEKNLEAVGDTAQAAGSQLSSMAKQASQVESNLEKTSNSTKRTTSSFEALRAAAYGVGGIIATVAFSNMMADALKAERELQRVTSALGINAQSMQEWQAVAKKSGVEADKMGDIFKDISDKIGDFALTGGGEAKDLFEALNLKIKDFKNLAPDKALERVGEALNKSGLTRSQKVFLLEGLADDASLLLPKLENITKELSKTRIEGEKSGSIFSKADLATLNEANKNLDALSTAWKGMSNNAGVAGATILNAFSPALQTAVGKIASGFNSLSDSAAGLADHIDLLIAPLAAIGAYMAGTLVTTITAYIASLAAATTGMTAGAVAAKALGGALALVGGPLGAIALGVGALTYFLVDLAKKQEMEGKAVLDLHGKYVDYHDITKTVVGYNSEYVNASTERKKAIIEETEALKANVLAEINALDARLKTLQGNYQKAVMADAANASPYVDDNGNLQYAVSLADKYKEQINALTSKIQELRSHYENLGTTEKAMNEGRVVGNDELKKTTEETKKATEAAAQQSTQLSITKQDQDLVAESFRKAVDVLRSHEDALKSTVESLQKQRIELEQGKAAAEYYTARLNGLTDAEAKAAAGANQYNAYLQERKRLQQEQAGLSGGLMDAYSAKLGDLGLDSLNFDGVVAQTNSAVTAADSYKNAVQGADDAIKKLGASAAQTMQTISSSTDAAVKVTEKQVGSAAKIVAEFQKLGWSREQALGIAANLKQESEFRTGAVGDGGRAYGLAQWHPDRQANFAKAFGKSIKDSDLLEQIRFVNYELTKGSEQAAGRILKSTTTAAEAARAVSRYYERPLARDVEMDRRAGIANALAKEMGGISTTAAAITTETAKTTGSISTQITAVKYLGQIDGQRVTDAERQSLIYQYMGIEAQKLVKSAQDQIDATTQNGLQLRANQLTQQQFSTDVQREILVRESMADYLAEERKINLDIAAIKDPSAPLREELAQKKLNAAQIESLVTLQQKAAVMKQLDDLQTNTAWVEREIQATQQGVAAMNQLTATREADNLAKQAGVTLESALGQQILASVTALQAKQRELQAIKQLTDDQKALGFLDAEIAATRQGSAALAEANLQKDIRNKLDALGLTQESELGKRIAETTRQLAAKNKELEAEQDIQKNLQGIRDLNAEIAATKLGSAALAEANLQKDIRNKLDQLGLTQESELGKRIAETTRQLAAKNKELQIEQTLRGLRTENAWLEKEIAATQQGETALKALNIQKRISEELDRQGIATGTQAAAQITSMIQQQEGLKEKLASIQELRQPISQFFNDVLSGGKNAFKNLGDYILNWLKKMIVEFATNKLMLNLGMNGMGGAGGISSLLGGSGGLFSSITGLVTKGLGGLGTALSGGLSGIMGSIGGFVSAIPGWGWALAGVAAIASKFIGPSDPKARFTQGATTGQAMLGQGGYGNNPHNYQTAFGQIGFTAASDHIGRQKGFVEAAHKMMQSMVVLDAMIAKTLPNSIGKISDALKGLETAGFSTAEMMKQRYVTIAKSLSTDLQAALANGKDLTAMSAEEIVAAFQYMSQVAESGLIPTLQQLGLAGNQSNESLLAFGIALSTAMGGIDKAKAALDNYYQAAYTDAERTAATQQQAKTALDAYNQSLGFSGAKYIDTVAELRAYIEAQDKNTEAGQKAIAAALGMVDALKTLGGTAEEAAQKLKGQWDAFNDAAYTDAQKQQIAQNQAKKAIDAFNQSLGLTGNKTIDNIIELRAYMRTLDGSTEAGRKAQQAALGMTSAFVAFGGTAEQIKQKIAGLRESIKGLVTNLYSSGSSTLTSTSSSTADSNQAALSAAQSNLDSLRSQLNSEQDRISEVNNQAKEAYQNQLDYYRTLKDAAENLRNVANGFADDARSAADVLKSAQLDYNRTLQAAKSGDVEAAKKLGDMATRLKSAVSIAYNNDGRATSAIQQIEDQLRTTAGVLDGLAGNQPNDPGTITSTLIASLQSQISAQESVVSSLQSIANSASSATNEAKATADRAAMAKELATKIGELGLATDKSAWDILTKNGINIKDLARDFGINVNQLDSTFVKKVAELSGLLNVNSLQMLNKLGVSVTDLAAAYGINTDRLNAGMVTKIGELAGALNVNSWQLLNKLGVSVTDLAAAYGINTDKLNAGMVTKIGELASTLNVNSWQLLSKLGVSVTDLAAAYGINTDRLNAGMVTKIGELAGTLNVNSWQLLGKLGVTAQEIAAAYGLNTDKLNQNFLTKLDSLADILRVSSVDLAAKLGVNIDKLGDLMANRLASLPNIPADIKAGLAPHLQDIRNAADPATLQRELKELQAYVNTLPPGIRAQLNAQLQGIVGNTGDQLTQTKADAVELQVIRNVKDKIWEQTVYIRDGIGGGWLGDLRANLRSLNNNAASIGKSAIPSFAVGSDKLPSDMLANVHRGEMIFTAAQSNSMRDLAIYNQSVIPQIASYLSEIAANDAQAPVFIQPVYVAPINSQRRTEGGRDELLEEIKGLRKDNAELKKAFEDLMPYQFAIANNTRKSAAMMDKWDTDGQPEERVA